MSPIANTVRKPKLILDTPRVFLPLVQRRRRFRGLSGGRGSGKSHFVAEDLVTQALSQHTRAVCAREIQNSIKDSSKQLLEDKINVLAHRYSGAIFGPDNQVLVPGDSKRFKHFTSKWRITEREIIYPEKDCLFIFRGLQNHTAASIKSLEGFTDFWGEEAQTLSQRSLDLAIPTFRKNSQLTFTWNPIARTDPVEELFRAENIKPLRPGQVVPAEQDPDFIWIEAQYHDNPWFPEELRRDMERDKRRDPDKYAHTWLGKYLKASAARVFRNWSVQEFETPRNTRFYFGADWGFSVDPTVLIRCFIVGDKLYIDREAYQVGCEIDNTPALFDNLDPDNPRMAREWPCVADSARPETISYMKRFGYPRIRPSIKGAGSVEDGIEFMKNYDIIVHPRCIHTIDELSTYSWKVDKKTNEILPILEDKKNHVIDACRYALEATRRGTYTLSTV
jgi:phage terminase large subunit